MHVAQWETQESCQIDSFFFFFSGSSRRFSFEPICLSADNKFANLQRGVSCPEPVVLSDSMNGTSLANHD